MLYIFVIVHYFVRKMFFINLCRCKILAASSHANKIVSLTLALVLYCLSMDLLMYIRIQRYYIDLSGNLNNGTVELSVPELNKDRKPVYEEDNWVPCSINPFCHPTVKTLMVDHINHYIYGPLCSVLDMNLGISENMLFLTPNHISFFHVFIALIGARLLTCQTLAVRRLGVVLFQLRMFLDDLDGHVARQRKHIKGEHSEVGSEGYWVDGVCDLLGVIAMMVGILCYLKANPPRLSYKGTPVSTLPYHQLKEMNSLEDTETEKSGIHYKTKVFLNEIIKVLLLFSAQMCVSSFAWNRYIYEYQEWLENCDYCNVNRRESVFQSNVFFLATGLWRIVNPHCYLHLLCLAIFCDKVWDFLTTVHLAGFVCLAVATVPSECLNQSIPSYVMKE